MVTAVGRGSTVSTVVCVKSCAIRNTPFRLSVPGGLATVEAKELASLRGLDTENGQNQAHSLEVHFCLKQRFHFFIFEYLGAVYLFLRLPPYHPAG